MNNYIANYEIGDRCFIENVGVMAVDRESSFGNGVRVSVLNETGGREVTISERLSSQLAYVVALYRHRPEFIAKVEELSAGYADSVRSATGSIGNDTRIVNVQYMSCVRVGEYARIEGAAKLVNGSIVSKKEAPTYIGNGVICTDFIVCSDSRIEDGVRYLLEFEEGDATELGADASARHFSKPFTLDAGSYLLVCGSRMASGKSE